jgi:hypothetical protein
MRFIVFAVGCDTGLLDFYAGTVSVARLGIYCHRWSGSVWLLGFDRASAR